MGPLRRRDRPTEGYRIRITLPAPWGRVGPWQTGFQSKRQGQAVEAWIREAALERPALIDGLVRGDFSLRDAWVAKLRTTPKRDAIGELMDGINDPPLAAAAQSYSLLTKDARARDGLLELSGLADRVEGQRATTANRSTPKPGTARLSWLLSATNINELYTAAVAGGRAPNSVRRSVHRAVAELLAHHFGKVRRESVMIEVDVPGADDTREVRVTADELGLLLAEFDVDFRDFTVLAMLLAVDQTPLALITPRLFDERMGTLQVLDSKTASRPRTIELSTPALSILRRRCAGHDVDELIFNYTKDQIRHRWQAARDRAAGVATRSRRDRGVADDRFLTAHQMLKSKGIVTLPVLRFKDLRHLLPTAWNALALPPEDLNGIMGWAKGSNMRERYTTARIQGDRENLDRVAAFLGLDRLHLRASGE